MPSFFRDGTGVLVFALMKPATIVLSTRALAIKPRLPWGTETLWRTTDPRTCLLFIQCSWEAGSGRWEGRGGGGGGGGGGGMNRVRSVSYAPLNSVVKCIVACGLCVCAHQ